MQKRAVVISCFHYYSYRVRPVLEELRGRGYACTYLTSDFYHWKKQPFSVKLPDCEQLHTLPYQRNLSTARIRSHARFARDAFQRIAELKPDLIYVIVPPNSLCRQAAQYKKEHPQVRLVFDLYDLWPETFPSGMGKRLLALPFAVWGRLRDRALPSADLIYAECDLYRQTLGDRLRGLNVQTLPLCRPEATVKKTAAPEGEGLALCWLGSINNIIDIDLLQALFSRMSALRPLTLHVIGDGEARGQLLAAAEAAGAEVVYHGAVYDPEARQNIFDRCHFGLNVMKRSVCIGLTMKSLDYLAGGLPLLNTVAGDTRSLLAQYGAGMEIDRADLSGTAARICAMTEEENTAMRINALRLFEERFSERAVREILRGVTGEEQ